MRKEKRERTKKSAQIKLTVIILVIIILVAGSLLIAKMLNKNKSNDLVLDNTTQNDVVENELYISLSGKKTDTYVAQNAPVFAVMIPNDTYGARPHTGLKDAGIIYESLTEGGITRFLALYQGENVEKIGPIRSLRLHFLSIAAGYNAAIVHVGGNDDALVKVGSNNEKYKNLDQMSTNKYFYRDYTYNKSGNPNTMYVSFEDLQNFSNEKKYKETSDFEPFARKDEKITEGEEANYIDIKISSSEFNPIYNYDATTNTYLRSYENGTKAEDSKKGQISPDVVVVMKMDFYTGEQDCQIAVTNGKGEAIVFQDGYVIKCYWEKESDFSSIKLVDANGENIKLNRGQTFISMIPKDKSVTYEKR